MNLSILFDYQIFFHQEYGGVSRYFIELARNLGSCRETTVQVYGGRHHNAFLEDASCDLDVIGCRVRRTASRVSDALSLARNAASFFVHASRASPTHIHQTYYYELFRPLGKATRIVTVYDMTHELFPDQFPAPARTSRAKRHAVDNADHVICISESTSRDLVRLFCVPQEKVTVIPLGLSVRLAELVASEQILPALHRRPYILWVGHRSGYKNFGAFLKAFGLSTMTREFDILCFGGGALTVDEIVAARGAGIDPSRITHVKGSDDLLAAAYRHAQFLIYPSLYEGFGFPPLEAMALQCPVACSNSSSMPEVVGDAAITFDPNSIDDMMRAIDSLAGDSDLRSRYRAAGSARASLFTWKRCTEATRELYLRTC